MKPLIRAAALLAGVLLSTSCAKFPATTTPQNTHLIFTMTVAGHVKDGSIPGESPYIYIVAMNPSTQLFPIGSGPISVIAPPWGNGFLAGNATHFVQYALGQIAPFTVYKFTTPDLLQFGPNGVPVSTSAQAATLRFEIDLSQITPTGVLPADLQSVQVNFLTMNRRPQGSDTGGKIWDALGDGRTPNGVNDFVRIPLTTSRIWTNSDFGDIEPVPPDSDCPDPDLDIISWSVEVRRP